MNFLEAVQALKDGRCEGIRRFDWHAISIENGMLQAGGKDFPITDSSSILADDWQFVNPRPVTETKEVKVWASVDSTTGRIWNVGTKGDMEIAVAPEPNLIKIVELTGTYEVPVKPKVKRREEITLDNEAHWRSVHFNSEIPDDTSSGHFFYEWEE